jgi:hypothetical protein
MNRTFACSLMALVWLGSNRPVHAQLRPLDPVDWQMFAQPPALSADLGMGAFADQHVSLTGTRGTLLEIGNFALGWKTGRVLLEASGTMVRRFHERETVRAPFEYVEDAGSGIRQDAGDMRVATVVRLSPEHWTTLLGLRFGTRLPTTNNRIGLDRDMTDFYALLIGRTARGALAASVEAGVGINGTRFPTYEQEDVLAYVLGVEYALPAGTLLAQLVGQDDLHGFEVRGNENLHELRLGVRIGARRWLRAQYVHGLTEFSPGRGVLLTAGMRMPN